jgi:hypothetical protein
MIIIIIMILLLIVVISLLLFFFQVIKIHFYEYVLLDKWLIISIKEKAMRIYT